MTQATGLFASVRTLLDTLLGTAQTRIELLVNELEEERLRMIRLLFYSLLMLFFLCMGVVLVTFLIVAVFWDTHRLLAIGIATVLYLAVAAWLTSCVMQMAKHRPRLFAASLAEIAKDRAAMESEP